MTSFKPQQEPEPPPPHCSALEVKCTFFAEFTALLLLLFVYAGRIVTHEPLVGISTRLGTLDQLAHNTKATACIYQILLLEILHQLL